ncbi:hypothetical protein Tco_0443347, partial [Tanacetum coccineum]
EHSQSVSFGFSLMYAYWSEVLINNIHVANISIFASWYMENDNYRISVVVIIEDMSSLNIWLMIYMTPVGLSSENIRNARISENQLDNDEAHRAFKRMKMDLGKVYLFDAQNMIKKLSRTEISEHMIETCMPKPHDAIVTRMIFKPSSDDVKFEIFCSKILNVLAQKFLADR